MVEKFWWPAPISQDGCNFAHLQNLSSWALCSCLVINIILSCYNKWPPRQRQNVSKDIYIYWRLYVEKNFIYGGNIWSVSFKDFRWRVRRRHLRSSSPFVLSCTLKMQLLHFCMFLSLHDDTFFVIRSRRHFRWMTLENSNSKSNLVIWTKLSASLVLYIVISVECYSFLT